MCCSYSYNVALRFLYGESFLGFVSPFLMPREVGRGAHLGSAGAEKEKGKKRRYLDVEVREGGGLEGRIPSRANLIADCRSQYHLANTLFCA